MTNEEYEEYQEIIARLFYLMEFDIETVFWLHKLEDKFERQFSREDPVELITWGRDDD